jgi:hypothetical protein
MWGAGGRRTSPALDIHRNGGGNAGGNSGEGTADFRLVRGRETRAQRGGFLEEDLVGPRMARRPRMRTRGTPGAGSGDPCTTGKEGRDGNVPRDGSAEDRLRGNWVNPLVPAKRIGAPESWQRRSSAG